MHSVPFVDSHTGGEPTRVILEAPLIWGRAAYRSVAKYLLPNTILIGALSALNRERAIPRSEPFWSLPSILPVRPASFFSTTLATSVCVAKARLGLSGHWNISVDCNLGRTGWIRRPELSALPFTQMAGFQSKTFRRIGQKKILEPMLFPAQLP
jgi:hypothetical protein